MANTENKKQRAGAPSALNVGEASKYGATLPEKHGNFMALAQGKCDYVLEVRHTKPERYGDMMTICATEEAVYITKQQAMAFFGLVEPTSPNAEIRG